MTPATYITLFRLLSAPLFAVLAIFYSRSLESGESVEALRWWAIVVFVVAAHSDLIDGYLARRCNQSTKLGAFLDPIADKLLILTTILILALFPWGEGWAIPIWFVGLVFLRDAIVWGGITVLHLLVRKVEISPHWTGKVCTTLLFVTIAWTGLKIIPLDPIYPTSVTACFIILAIVASIRQGLDLLHAPDLEPDPDPEHNSDSDHVQPDS